MEGERWLEQLETAPPGQLERLSVVLCSLGDAEAACLARWPIWHSLRRLHILANPGITATGWTQLIDAMSAGFMRTLSLFGCSINESVLRLLLDAPHLAGLQQLWIDTPAISAATRRKLKKRFGERAA